MDYVAFMLMVTGLYGLIRGKVAGPINNRAKSAVLLVLGIILLVISLYLNYQPQPVAATVVTPPPVQAQQAQPQPPTYDYNVVVDGTRYMGKTFNDTGVAVVGIRTVAAIGTERFYRQAQGQFMLVQVAITNQKNERITIRGSEFGIVLPNGKEYNYDADAAFSYGPDKGAIIITDINPDMRKVGWLVFDVPPGLDQGAAQLRFDSGYTNRSVHVPLAPIGS